MTKPRLARSPHRRALGGLLLVISLVSWLFFAGKHTSTFLIPALMWLVLAAVTLLAPERPVDPAADSSAG